MKLKEAAVHGRGFGKNDIKNFEKKAGVCLEFFSKLLIECLPGRVQNAYVRPLRRNLNAPHNKFVTLLVVMLVLFCTAICSGLKSPFLKLFLQKLLQIFSSKCQSAFQNVPA